MEVDWHFFVGLLRAAEHGGTKHGSPVPYRRSEPHHVTSACIAGPIVDEKPVKSMPKKLSKPASRKTLSIRSSPRVAGFVSICDAPLAQTLSDLWKVNENTAADPVSCATHNRA